MLLFPVRIYHGQIHSFSDMVNFEMPFNIILPINDKMNQSCHTLSNPRNPLPP